MENLILNLFKNLDPVLFVNPEELFKILESSEV